MAYGITMGKKNKDALTEMEKLASRNENIVSVFARTVQDLKDVNFDMELAVEKRLAQVEDINTEIETLNNVRNTNESIMNKINGFLS